VSTIIENIDPVTILKVKSLIEGSIPYQILSLGGGVQSSTLWLRNIAGEIEPQAEFAVFADTGWEREGTYAYLDYLDEKSLEAGFPPIMRVSAGNIRADMLKDGDAHYDHMPLYTDSGKKKAGMLNRQCTNHYKVAVIKREVRRIFGMKKRIQWIGFSVDEIDRRNDSNFPKYISPRYPLLEERWDRQDCKDWLADNGHPVPVKSSCVGCPYRKDIDWHEMKVNFPDEFADGRDFDAKIRHKHLNRPKREKAQLELFELPEPSKDLFLHESMQDLGSVDFLERNKDSLHEQQECQGGCFL
jgi:hypothetical protein